MNEMGKILVVLGLVLVAVGAVLSSGVGKSWFGRLPGDIHVERENFSLHFPIVTCLILILSLILTVVLRLLRK